MSLEVERVNQPTKILEVARFTSETLKIATPGGNKFICGWKKPPAIDQSSHILIEANFGDGYSVIGDGWAHSTPKNNDDRFGDPFPYTVKLTDVRIIADPENFLPTCLKWPAMRIAQDIDSPTFARAATRVAQLDQLWALGLTDEVKVIKTWEL